MKKSEQKIFHISIVKELNFLHVDKIRTLFVGSNFKFYSWYDKKNPDEKNNSNVN